MWKCYWTDRAATPLDNFILGSAATMQPVTTSLCSGAGARSTRPSQSSSCRPPSLPPSCFRAISQYSCKASTPSLQEGSRNIAFQEMMSLMFLRLDVNRNCIRAVMENAPQLGVMCCPRTESMFSKAQGVGD